MLEFMLHLRFRIGVYARLRKAEPNHGTQYTVQNVPEIMLSTVRT